MAARSRRSEGFRCPSWVLALVALAACSPGPSTVPDGGAPDAAWVDVVDDDAGPIVRVSDIGAPCSQNGDCSAQTPQAACWTQSIGGASVTISFPGGYCVLACGSQADCPNDSVCVLLGGAGLCLQRCERTADCRADAGYCCFGDPFAANLAVCGAVDAQHQSACAP